MQTFENANKTRLIKVLGSHGWYRTHPGTERPWQFEARGQRCCLRTAAKRAGLVK